MPELEWSMSDTAVSNPFQDLKDAVVSLPGVQQVSHALGLTGCKPSSLGATARASKVVSSKNQNQSAFVKQTARSRTTYTGGGSKRDNTAGAMPPETKAQIAVLAIGQSVPDSTAIFTDFLLTSIHEQDAEKTEVSETFGAFHLFAAGRYARRYTFTGRVRAHPQNHASTDQSRTVPHAVTFRLLYENYLRATEQAKNQTYTRITADRDSYDGWITTMNFNRSAADEFWTDFVFTMVAFRRTHEKDMAANNILQLFASIKGVSKKVTQRLKAEVAAAIGVCTPQWLIDGSVSSTIGTKNVSDDDTGRAVLRNSRTVLHGVSADNTGVNGVCKLSATINGVAVKLSTLGITSENYNLAADQTVFTSDLDYDAVYKAAADGTATLSVTATGQDAKGSPVLAELSAVLKLVSAPRIKIVGYDIYRNSDNTKILSVPVSGTVEITDTSLALATALSLAGTSLDVTVKPVCVGAKSGNTVAAPDDLVLTLQIVHGSVLKQAKAGKLLDGGLRISNTYSTDLTQPGGTIDVVAEGASGIDITIAVPTQDVADPAPLVVVKLLFGSAHCFAFASPFVLTPSMFNESYAYVALSTPSKAAPMPPSSYLAIARLCSISASDGGINVSVSPTGGALTYRGQIYSLATPTSSVVTDSNGIPWVVLRYVLEASGDLVSYLNTSRAMRNGRAYLTSTVTVPVGFVPPISIGETHILFESLRSSTPL